MAYALESTLLLSKRATHFVLAMGEQFNYTCAKETTRFVRAHLGTPLTRGKGSTSLVHAIRERFD